MKPKRKTHAKAGEPQRITRAVTHIHLVEVNPGKLAALHALAPVYLALCQQYVTLFCTEELPNKLRAPLYLTALSKRWHRAAIMQANVNVVKLEASEDSTFDYWLTISTLEKGKPILVPVKLAKYHHEALKDKKINSSVRLNKRADGWWLTLTYDELITVQMKPDAPVVGIDAGIANFVTTSTGERYGTFHGKLRERQKRDREKRHRKAKLRACLKKNDAKKLPSTSSLSGQRLMRHVRQEINRAVNQCFSGHPGAQFAYEQLSAASMKFKARAMNAYLRASNRAHIPQQIAWNATKRGVQATLVKSAYSSQECNVCHYTHRKNRPDQRTFRCQVCGHEAHADMNAARNIQRRVGDKQLRACKDRTAIKALLMKRRHEAWKKHKESQRSEGRAELKVSSPLT